LPASVVSDDRDGISALYGVSKTGTTSALARLALQ
jgi:hypothetical protein